VDNTLTSYAGSCNTQVDVETSKPRSPMGPSHSAGSCMVAFTAAAQLSSLAMLLLGSGHSGGLTLYPVGF